LILTDDKFLINSRFWLILAGIQFIRFSLYHPVIIINEDQAG